MKNLIEQINKFESEQWARLIGDPEKAIPSKAQTSAVAACLAWAAEECGTPILMLGQEVHMWTGKYYAKGDIHTLLSPACAILRIPLSFAIDPDFISKVEKSLSVVSQQNRRGKDLSPRGINFQDGWLKITQKTVEFHNGHESDVVFTYCLPFTYKGKRNASKVWTPFIESIVPNEVLRNYIMCSFANAIACDPMKAQRMMLLMGVGASGKSTLIDAVVATITDEFNPENTNTCRIDDLRNLTKDESRFRIDLATNILCICGDASGDIGNKDVLKQIVSKEAIAGRRLYREVEYFVPRASLVVASNEIGFTHALGDSGISRRIDIIQFNNPVAEKDRDPHIGEKLAAPNEQREMVLDMISCLISMQNEHGKMVRPAVLDEALNDLRYDGDTFLSFLGNAGLDVARKTDADSECEDIHQDKLFRAYVMFSAENGVKSGSVRNLKGKCASHGVIKEGAGQRKHKFKFKVVDRESYDKAMLILLTPQQYKL